MVLCLTSRRTQRNIAATAVNARKRHAVGKRHRSGVVKRKRMHRQNSDAALHFDKLELCHLGLGTLGFRVIHGAEAGRGWNTDTVDFDLVAGSHHV